MVQFGDEFVAWQLFALVSTPCTSELHIIGFLYQIEQIQKAS